VWRAIAEAFQFVRSPPCDGSSVGIPDTGFCRFQLPFAVMLTAWPLVDEGGATSMVAYTMPWSVSRSLPTGPDIAGTPSSARMSSRRLTESAATPEARSPSASVLSSVCRSLERRPSWYAALKNDLSNWMGPERLPDNDTLEYC
jgi:hypothetical protein